MKVYIVLITLILIIAGCSGQSNDTTSDDETNTPDASSVDTCGDGVCDKKEELTKRCPKDCLPVVESHDSLPESIPEPVVDSCGDGVCDKKEEITGRCPKDCPSVVESTDSLPDQEKPEPVVDPCGDGECNKKEELTGRCPGDCQ